MAVLFSLAPNLIVSIKKTNVIMTNFNVKGSLTCQMLDGIDALEQNKQYSGKLCKTGIFSYTFVQDPPKPKYAQNKEIYSDDNLTLRRMRVTEKRPEEGIQFFGHWLTLPTNEDECKQQAESFVQSVAKAYDAYYRKLEAQRTLDE